MVGDIIVDRIKVEIRKKIETDAELTIMTMTMIVMIIVIMRKMMTMMRMAWVTE